MIALNASKLAASIKSLQGVRKKVADTADGVYRQKLYWLYEQAVRVSPQYSGDFASNWNIVVDGNTPVYKPNAAKLDMPVGRHDNPHTGAAAYRVTPHQAGDPEAIATALARGAAQLRGVTRKSRVHLMNATALHVDDAGQFMLGPDGKEKLRPENVIPGGTSIEIYVRTQAQAIPKPTKTPEEL